MPSSLLRLSDLRVVRGLTHRCRDRGDDPLVWWGFWVRRIARLTDATAGAAGELVVGRDGRLDPVRSATVGVGVGLEALRHELAVGETIVDAADEPPMLAIRGYTLTGLCPVPGAIGEYTGVVLTRAADRPDFTAHEAALVREAHTAVSSLVGGALARFGEPAPSALPPRVRQVLKSLLDGDSDKQIATRMGISIYTVNQYVKFIFVHFGVNTRAELLARWLRRGWGSRAAWADD